MNNKRFTIIRITIKTQQEVYYLKYLPLSVVFGKMLGLSKTKALYDLPMSDFGFQEMVGPGGGASRCKSKTNILFVQLSIRIKVLIIECIFYTTKITITAFAGSAHE